jgi:O-antigen/teichoic acid export membrane protein
MSAELTEPAVQASENHTAYHARVKTISRQSVIYLVGMAFNLAGAYLFKIYAARNLGAEALGYFALGMSLVALFSLFANLGLPRAMVRYVPTYLAQQNWGALKSLIWIGSGVVTVLSVAIALVVFSARDVIADQIFHKPEMAPVMALMAFIIPLGVIGNLFDQIMVGFKRTATSKTISSFFTFPLSVALAVLLITLGYGLMGYIAATLLSLLAGVLLLGYFIWRALPMPARSVAASNALPRAVISFSAFLLGMSIIDYASGNTDNIVLGLFLPAAALGIYSIATTTSGFVSILLVAVNAIFAPIIAETYALREHAILEELFQTLTRWMSALTIPVYLVVLVYAAELLSIFGADFTSGTNVLMLLATSEMINVATGSCGYMLLMSGHERPMLYTKVALAFLAPLSYFLLIPPLGIFGAALTSFVVTIVTNGLWVILIARYLKMSPYNLSFLRLIAPTLVTIVGLFALHTWSLGAGISFWGNLLLGAAAAYLVFGVVWLTIGLNHQDRELVNTAVRRATTLRF